LPVFVFAAHGSSWVTLRNPAAAELWPLASAGEMRYN
jgi:hypothetical protein